MQTNDVFSRTESSGPTLSPAIYNLAIGMTLCWGFLANFLIVRTVPVEPSIGLFRSIGPSPHS